MIPCNPAITHSKSGFTLLEVIISITVAAILAVVLVELFGTYTARSWRPMQSLTRNLALQSAMDQITSDYRNLILTDSQPLVTLQSNIEDGNYWSGNDIQATDNDCVNFIESAPGSRDWNEGEVTVPCTHSPNTVTALKVTLSLENQTLTSLFTQ